MSIPRRLLGLLWTLAAAVPFAPPAEVQLNSSVTAATAPNRGPRPESRSSLGAVKISLGESVLRDLKTPFIGTPSFQLGFARQTVAVGPEAVRRSGGQTAHPTHNARAPPALT